MAEAKKSDLAQKLLKKSRKELTVTIELSGDPVELKFRAISQNELDKLRAKHKPTTEQKAQGLGVNLKSFQPALVAATLVDPELTEEEVQSIWTSDDWSEGELGNLFNAASTVCMAGFDVPRSAND